jgi:hypothetical protein
LQSTKLRVDRKIQKNREQSLYPLALHPAPIYSIYSEKAAIKQVTAIKQYL